LDLMNIAKANGADAMLRMLELFRKDQTATPRI